jgi:hypothetical protein
MAPSTMENGETVYHTAKENVNMLTEVGMMDNGEMDSLTVMV